MRIIQVLTELGAGGAERVVLELSKALKAAGHEAAVLSLSAPPENRAIPDALAEAGIETAYAAVEKRAPWTATKLAGALRALRPDLVHSHLLHPNILTRLAKPFVRRPLLNTVHIADRRAGMKPWFLMDRLSFPLCDACTAVSKAAARFHETALGLPQGSIEVVYNGLDLVRPAPEEETRRLKAEWGLEDCAKIVGSVGRLAPQKGYDVLLSRLEALSSKVPEGERWGVLIIGEGPERKRLEELAAKAPGNLRVSLPGFRADAAALMALFDVFVMPSRYEGYGLSLAEAMGQGLPAVCAPIDSLPELCELYEGDALCADFQGDEAFSAIARFATRPKARPFLLSSVEEMAERYLKLYKRISGAA